MAKLNMRQIEDLCQDDDYENDTIPAPKTKRVKSQIEQQSGMISSKIHKITKDLIPSEEDRALQKKDEKRMKKK